MPIKSGQVFVSAAQSSAGMKLKLVDIEKILFPLNFLEVTHWSVIYQINMRNFN